MVWASPEIDLCKKVFTADSFLIRNPAELQPNNSFKSPSPTNLERTCWRGVNLGGWLVLEKWMAPDLFALVPSADDERSLLAEGGSEARDAVAKFRETFITQEDLHWLRHEGGIDAVRLPVGFWCLDEFAASTPMMSTQRYVDAVFDWAEKYGLKVLLELHGLVGSQNGEHHSGDSGMGVLGVYFSFGARMALVGPGNWTRCPLAKIIGLYSSGVVGCITGLLRYRSTCS